MNNIIAKSLAGELQKQFPQLYFELTDNGLFWSMAVILNKCPIMMIVVCNNIVNVTAVLSDASPFSPSGLRAHDKTPAVDFELSNPSMFDGLTKMIGDIAKKSEFLGSFVEYD